MGSIPSISTTVRGELSQIEPIVRAALAAEGFGILTEIDMAGVLKAKIGVERSPLKWVPATRNSRIRRSKRMHPPRCCFLATSCLNRRMAATGRWSTSPPPIPARCCPVSRMPLSRSRRRLGLRPPSARSRQRRSSCTIGPRADDARQGQRSFARTTLGPDAVMARPGSVGV